ncbi:MAG TPA: ATP-binding protein [Bryobacteraceae bacterium]|nr:ATP-binding protein [Bryobacteraceae bacterium]
MGKPLRLLQVEDLESDAALVVRLLRKAGYDVDSERVEDATEMRRALAARAWDVIIADYRLPQFDARGALAILQETGKDIPFIVVSGTIGEDVAVEMMRSGAQDYLMKDNLARLAPTVEREIREAGARLERRRAVQALQESETRYRQLANAMPQIVWTATADGQLEYCNERWYALTGQDPTFTCDDSWESILHPEDRQLWRDTWSQSVRQGAPCEILYRLYDRRTEAHRWFLGRALPARDPHGRILRWFGTCTDIDDHKRVEDALRRANQDLEQFAYSVSHDLREPLRTISIFGELLERQHSQSLPGEALEYVAYLTGAARRMDALVLALRTYTSAAELRPMELPFTDAGAAAAEAIANLDALIREHRAEVVVARLPTIPMHYHHVVQVFQNLLANGITYHQPGTPPRVRLSVLEHGASWEFLVQDEGIGIAPEYHERIFGIFKRLHTAAEGFPGTGVGLAICKKIIEMNAGAIKVTSAVGHGSTFHITIPKQQPGVPAQRTA